MLLLVDVLLIIVIVIVFALLVRTHIIIQKISMAVASHRIIMWNSYDTFGCVIPLGMAP